MEHTAPTTGFEPDFTPVMSSEQPSFLRELRSSAERSFSETGLPERRQEAWRFTPLSTITNTAFEPRSGTSKPAQMEAWNLAGSLRLIFVDGHLVTGEPSSGHLPDGVTVTDLATASKTDPELVQPHLGRLAEPQHHSFVALNTALLQNGAFVHIARGAALERPIHFVFMSTSTLGPTASYPRNLVVLEDNAEATVVESHVGDDGKHLSCPVSEIVLGRGARLHHHRIQEEASKGSHVSCIHVHQKAASTYSSTTLSMGAALTRNDVHVSLHGEGAHCRVDGLYLPRARQLVDNHLRIEHAAAHCTSDQLFKGVLADRSRSVFNGTVVVNEGAQKTDARQSNRNLLLSDDARAHSNPQLEIFADDVRCTHGSATGKLDQEAIFYLRSRGIGRAEAEQLLIHAFAAEVVGRTGLPELEDRLEQLISERLPVATEPGDRS